jgi:hypothetical protein
MVQIELRGATRRHATGREDIAAHHRETQA